MPHTIANLLWFMLMNFLKHWGLSPCVCLQDVQHLKITETRFNLKFMILILYRDLFFLLALISINSVIYNKWFIFFFAL